MMRFIYLYFIFFAISVPAQQTVNRFEQAEYPAAVPENGIGKDEEVQPAPPENLNFKDSGGGIPADPTPIDDFLPLLVIAGIGLIAWKVRKRGVTL